METLTEKHVIRWRKEELRFTIEATESFYKELQNLISENIAARRPANEKRYREIHGKNYRFSTLDAESLSYTLAKFLVMQQERVPLNVYDVPLFLSRETIATLCRPLECSNQLIGRVWSVFCNEAFEIPGFRIWCDQCTAWTSDCQFDVDETRELHYEPRRLKYLKLPVESIIEHKQVFDQSKRQQASARVKQMIRTLTNSIEAAMA